MCNLCQNPFVSKVVYSPRSEFVSDDGLPGGSYLNTTLFAAEGYTDSIGADIASAYPLRVGVQELAAIHFNGDVDVFKVDLVAGTRYVFKVNKLSSSSNLDTVLRLYDSAGNFLKVNDDINVLTRNYDSLLTLTPATSGTYYLGVSASSNASTGGYSIVAEQAPWLPTLSNDEIATRLTTPSWGQFTVRNITYNVTALSSPAQALAHAAFQAWADVCNLTFTAVSTTANITFSNNQPGAYTTRSGNSAVININSRWNNGDTTFDSYTYQTFIHEVGHALGLNHPATYNGTGTYGVDNTFVNDNWATTIMSYFDQFEADFGTSRYVLTPMVADILAVQSLYGASTNTRTGNTNYGDYSNAGGVYDFSNFSRATAFTIYDGGGTDSLLATRFWDNQIITLFAEQFSSIGGLRNNITIARGVVIENAAGGGGNDVLIGNGTHNVLAGGAGNDSIWANDGNDTLIGGIGNDFLAGEAGFDTAVFGGKLSSANIWRDSAGNIGVTSGDGTDTLSGIEFLKFDDFTIRTYRAMGQDMMGDFNGDGRADSLWRSSTGEMAIVAGGPGGSIVRIELPKVNYEWRVEGVGDFNRDGRADILWRNNSGALIIWQMSTSGTVGNWSSLPSVASDWSMGAVADFNADGSTDILWRNANGTSMCMWTMNAAGGMQDYYMINGPGNDWKIQGTGDFNGDGRADILWRNTDGSTCIWNMNGGTMVSWALPGAASTDWQVQGIGDFNGDGRADILWRHSSGMTSIWNMAANGAILSSAGIGTISNDWQVQGIRDMNGDGCADVFWRHTGGNSTVWTINNSTLQGQTWLGGSDPSWTWL